MKKFILASNNPKKLTELSQILSDLGAELLTQREAGADIVVDETGDTFEENAYLKASAVTMLTGLPAIADDSGLAVDFLGGAPGVYTARYGGEGLTDRERYEYLLKKMEGVKQRDASFVSCIACTFPNGDIIRARGECEGEILDSPHGGNGFGYDPVFRPKNSELSMAELPAEEKNEISHRGKALKQFKGKLRLYYADK
jgi:XTP/dITP diphosphohydrolase